MESLWSYCVPPELNRLSQQLSSFKFKIYFQGFFFFFLILPGDEISFRPYQVALGLLQSQTSSWESYLNSQLWL